MYAKRIQITNYGPIDQLDITFPFEGDTPKPVVLVGENGSGKSILLSHIVNGLISAKDSIYTETPEVEVGKLYKLRSNYYIKSEREFYFARVDFENRLFTEEMRSVRLKREYSGVPTGLSGTDTQSAWEKMEPDKVDYFNSTFLQQFLQQYSLLQRTRTRKSRRFSPKIVFSIFLQIALKIQRG